MTTVERPNPLHVVVGCGEFYQKNWWNIDFIESPPNTPHGTYPDEVVGDRAWESFKGIDRLLMAHVLEHIPQAIIRESLTGWRDACTPGAQVCIVGPEFNVALGLFKSNELTLDALWQRGEPGSHTRTLDHWLDYYTRNLDSHPGYHQWSCTTERAQALMILAGFVDVRVVDILSNELYPWPIVSKSPDQFALMCTAP